MSQFSGVYPILYAFYDKNGKLDDGLMRLQVEKCIATGAHGIAVLGLVTEVHKLDVNERTHLVKVVGQAINGRVPYAVTVGELSLHGQSEFAKMAKDHGADWVILQPPGVKGYTEAEYVRFLGTVADGLDMPVAIQNNPVNMDVSLSNASLQRLRTEHPNITMLKGEGPALGVAEVIKASEGRYGVFAGHGGKEYISNVLSGCVGLVPAPDCLEHQIKLHQLLVDGRVEEAEALHARLLPLILFMTNSVPNMLCYGKRLFAERIGIKEVHARAPEIQPTEFGLSEVKRMTRGWGPL
ncbi:MAG TPA: dihydrodipicolinate synthase family protein [Polaromonas sp.]|uniref:dihydrodipicolinate synthase family protein n=1 Tax=Polaromonas sp. TaxID=1869339 RepID=UPI002D48DE08|nr:dihydrodipicolinate synthase family protein [Polaromonas sp.]HYW55567.1 dihydrodipicolinate synthase family protein [Polaromonas sp.]